MNLFAGKLRLFSLVIVSAIVAGSSTPQKVGAATSTPKLSGIKEIVASSGFWGGSSFAVGKDGSVWGWGSNINGQFANGTAGPEGWTITPHRVEALDSTKQLVIGSSYYLALKEDKTVMAWGDFPRKGAEGMDKGTSGHQHDVLLPQVISGLTDVVSITSGIAGNLALKEDGTLMQWNPPQSSETGYTELPPATKVQGLTHVSWIGSSYFHAAVRENGTLWMWSPEALYYHIKLAKVPTQIKDLYHVKSVSQKEDSLIALTESGSVWATAWDDKDKSSLTMKKMPGLSGIVSVQTGNGFNLVKNKKGEYWLWKKNTNLQDLQKVKNITNISKLMLDLDGLVAVKKDGTAWTWKYQYISENKSTFTQPKQIKGMQSPVSFATGENSKYAVMKDGTAVAWGTNMFGQLGISAVESRPFTVSPILKPVTVILNGKKLVSTQSAIYSGGSVLVPIRDVVEGLGYAISWDGDMKLSKGDKEVTYKDGEYILNDGNIVPKQLGAIRVSYTTLVPVATLAKALGASATWDGALYQLTLQTQR